MAEEAIKISGKKKSMFIDKVKQLLPEGGQSQPLPDLRRLLVGLPGHRAWRAWTRASSCAWPPSAWTRRLLKSEWVWMCTMCQRCIYVCPMKIDIPQLVFNARRSWPRDQRPKGILRLLRHGPQARHLQRHGRLRGGLPVRGRGRRSRRSATPRWAGRNCRRRSTSRAPMYFLNQNSREPVTEPDEMVPLWKILHLAGADWTYGTKGWAAENYCMFMADNESLEAHRGGEGQGRGRPRLQILAQHGVRARTLRSPGRTEKVQHPPQVRDHQHHPTLCPVDSRGQAQGQLRLEQGPQGQVHGPGPLPAGAQELRRPRGRGPALRGQSGGGRGELRRHDPQPLQQLLLRRRRRVPAVRATRRRAGPTASSRSSRSWPPVPPTAITPCHNCHAQIHDLSEHYEGGYHTVHLWTLICLAMGILGPNETDLPRRGPGGIADAGDQGGGRVRVPSTHHHTTRKGRAGKFRPCLFSFHSHPVSIALLASFQVDRASGRLLQLHRADLELGDPGYRVQRGVGQAVGGGPGVVERDEDGPGHRLGRDLDPGLDASPGGMRCAPAHRPRTS